MKPTTRRYRSASELATFAYCRKSWWLRHGLGHEPADHRRLERGRAEHARWGRTLRRADRWRLAAWLLGLLGLGLLLWG
ncbi:MAG: hypothetical protein ACH37Z_13615 [Anaerolineae bacterium]|nr:hypothetical protein [Ardenticatenia bacterium]MBK8541867.1 hypothetical protein [Ardenticatenia bacterium]HQZ70462.1 hypothetical protein [Anaerolineae bacterium]